MDTETILGMINTLQMIKNDCKSDVEKREGQIFNGHNIAVALGEIQAQISALANIQQHILEDQLKKLLK